MPARGAVTRGTDVEHGVAADPECDLVVPDEVLLAAAGADRGSSASRLKVTAETHNPATKIKPIARRSPAVRR
jgi:hypothetical protein